MTAKHSLFLFLVIGVVFGADDVRPQPLNPQISFSYWNDNFAFQRQLSSVIPPGDDDYLTASFRLEGAWGSRKDWRGLELYYAIFTNRSEGHRFDMLAGRWFRERQMDTWRYKVGVGGLIRGPLGGGAIQDSYHRLRGYSEVDLPYLEEWRFGVLFYGRLARDLLKVGNTSLSAYTSSALRLGAGPTNLRVGMEAETSQKIPRLPVRVTLLGRVGYAHYLKPREVIEAHFSQGMVVGVYLGMVLQDKIALSTWVTENQYGLDDPHYGVTLSYRFAGLILPKLDSIMFP